MARPGQMVQVNGIQTVLRALEKLRDNAVPAARKGLEAAGENILILARYYCPKDTGALAESGRIEVLDQFGSGATQLRLQVVFGGKVGFTEPRGTIRAKPDSGYAGPAHLQGDVVYYAVPVHEDLSAQHAPPTCAKFLERAVRENWQNVSYLIGRHLEEVVRADVNADSRAVRPIGRMKIPDAKS